MQVAVKQLIPHKHFTIENIFKGKKGWAKREFISHWLLNSRLFFWRLISISTPWQFKNVLKSLDGRSKRSISHIYSFISCLILYIPGGKDDDGGSIKSGLGSLSGSSGLSKKQRKARTAFTDHQLQTLEKSFERQKYLSVQDRMELANKLGLSDTQVKTWYQNRR